MRDSSWACFCISPLARLVKCLNRKHFETLIWLNSDSASHEVVIAPAALISNATAQL
jgi:hypothetical protein